MRPYKGVCIDPRIGFSLRSLRLCGENVLIVGGQSPWAGLVAMSDNMLFVEVHEKTRQCVTRVTVGGWELWDARAGCPEKRCYIGIFWTWRAARIDDFRSCGRMRGVDERVTNVSQRVTVERRVQPRMGVSKKRARRAVPLRKNLLLPGGKARISIHSYAFMWLMSNEARQERDTEHLMSAARVTDSTRRGDNLFDMARGVLICFLQDACDSSRGLQIGRRRYADGGAFLRIPASAYTQD